MIQMSRLPARVKKTVRDAKVLKSVDHAAVMELVDMGVSKSPAGNSVRVRLPPAAPIALEFSKTLAYIVGVALGDGNLSRPNGRATRLRITCDAKYPRLAAEIVSSLTTLFPKNKVSKVERTSTYFDISVYSNTLDSLMPWSVGAGPKKVQVARVPGWIKNDLHLSKACLKGLLQTDGCIYQDRGYQMLSFTNNTRELAEDVQEIFEKMGVHPRFASVNNGGFQKFSVRLARAEEVKRVITILSLHKT